MKNNEKSRRTLIINYLKPILIALIQYTNIASRKLYALIYIGNQYYCKAVGHLKKLEAHVFLDRSGKLT